MQKRTSLFLSAIEWTFILSISVIGWSMAGFAQGQGKNTAKTAPAAPKSTGPQNNPFYSSWASFKVGTETDYELTVTKGAIVTKLPLHYILVENNADRVVLELNFPASRRVVIPANLTTAKDYTVDNLDVKPEMVGAQGWPALLFQLVYPPFVKTFSGHENVVIEGKTFDCRYGSTTNELGMKMKQWFSPEVAGGLVKSRRV
jgi:hypothetical protein